MTLAELSCLVGAEPKWVLNALAALGRPKRYTLELARRLSVTLAIHEATGAPLARSLILGERALRAHERGADGVILTDREDVGVVPDIPRILSSLNIRRSFLNSSFAPRVRGRARGGRDPLRVATDWGLDLGLVKDNLARTVEARIRQLDSMAAFAHGVHLRAVPES